MAFPSPTLEAPTLENFQYEYNELVFGANTPYGVILTEGLDLATIRSGDTDWPRDHGQAKGLDLYAGRDLIFDLWMKTDGTSLQHAQLALAAATIVQPNEELPLWFQLPNLPLLCVMCRPRLRPMKIETDYAAGNIGKPELHLHATDPRIYTAAEAVELKPNVPAKSKVFTNLGNTEMRPIVIFTGPLARPRITNEAIAGKPFIEISRGVRSEEEELQTREGKERARKVKRYGEEEAARKSRIKSEAKTLKEAEEKEIAETLAAEKAEEAARIKAEEEEYEEKVKKEEAKEVYLAKRERRETKEKEAVKGREGNEAYNKSQRIIKEEEAKVEAEKDEVELREEEEATEKTKSEEEIAAEKVAREEREEDEKASEEPTVKAGDQILVDLGTPHLAQYWEGGVGVGEPKDVMGWLTSASQWWDLLPGNNTLKFSSYDAAATAGVVEVQFASAYEI